MPASLITLVGADLAQLRKNLEEGKRLWRDFAREANKAAAQAASGLGAAPSGFGRGGVAGGMASTTRRSAASTAAESAEKDAELSRARAAQKRRTNARLLEKLADEEGRTVSIAEQRLRENLRKQQLGFESRFAVSQGLASPIFGRTTAEKKQRQLEKEETARIDAAIRGVNRLAKEEENQRKQQIQSASKLAISQGLASPIGGRAAQAKTVLAAASTQQARRESIATQAAKATASEVDALFKGVIQRTLKGAVTDVKNLGREFDRTGQRLPNLGRLIQQNLNESLERTGRILNQIGLASGVTLVGALGAIGVKAIELNKQFEQANLTLAATLALSHDVVDAQGKLVEGPEKANFLLKQTPDFFQTIRKVANETLLEQNELIQTISENITFASRAGLKFETEGQRKQATGVIANIAQLARAIGLPGGQRQLSQETRALFLGERLQGAQIAQVLGFRSAAEIQKLQAEPSKQGNQNRFIDTLLERLKSADPILKRFRDSFTGVTTTLTSQIKEFLRLASQPIFERLSKALQGLRDQLGDEQIKAAAAQIGEAIATSLDALIRFGRSPEGRAFFDLLKFLVRNAGVITGALLAIGAASKVGRGVGTLAALGGRGVGAAAGAAGAAGGGLLGTLGRGTLTALGGTIGAGFVVATAAFFGGIAFGTLIRKQFEKFLEIGTRRPLQLGERGRKVEEEAPGVAAELQSRRSAISRLRRQARGLRERGSAEAFEETIEPEFNPLLALLRGSPLRRTRRRTIPERVLPQALEAGAARLEAGLPGARALATAALHAKRLAKLQAKENQEADELERLQASKALAEVLRNRETAIILQAEIDKRGAQKEIKDKKALAVQLQAIEKQKFRDLKELREDDFITNQEILARGAKDERRLLNLRTQQELQTVERRTRGNPALQAQLRGAILQGARRERTSFELGEQGRALGFAQGTAQNRGQTIRAIQLQAQQERNEVLRALNEREITQRAATERIRSIEFKTAEEIRQKRRETNNEAIDLLQQYTTAITNQVELRKQRARDEEAAQERLGDRAREINRRRRDDEEALTNAVRSQTEARENLALGTGRRGILAQVRAFAAARSTERSTLFTSVPGAEEGVLQQFSSTRTGQSLLDRLSSVFTRQQAGGLAESTRRQLGAQQANEFVTQLSETLQGPEGVARAREQLAGAGLGLTRQDLQTLANLAVQSGGLRAQQQQLEEGRGAAGEERAVTEAGLGVTRVREGITDAEEEDRRFFRDFARDRKDAQEAFVKGLRDSALELSRLGETIREFFRQLQPSGIALPANVSGALARVSPLAAGAGSAANRIVAAADVARQQQAGLSTTNIYLDGIKIAPDTQKLVEELARKLERDARRTPTN